MNAFGDDLIQSLNEALAHAKGEGPAIVHVPVAPREVRKQAKSHHSLASRHSLVEPRPLHLRYPSR